MPNLDKSILEAALIGYEAERRKLQEKIADIQRRLGRRSTRTTPGVDGAPRPKRQMSAAARKRIVAAQKKRWAEYHARQNAQN